MKAFIYFVAIACFALAVTAAPDASAWVGSWSIDTTTCSTATCCCVTGAVSISSVTSTSLKVVVALEGQCGGQYSTKATVATPESGVSSITFSALGQSVTATKLSSDRMQATAGTGCGSATFNRGPGQSATWTGKWDVTTSSCPRSTCCCVADQVNVAVESSSTLTIVAGLAGVCGGSTSVTATAVTPSGALAFAFDAPGMTAKAEKTGVDDMKAIGSGSGSGCGEAQLHRTNAGFVQTVSAFLLLALVVVATL